MAYEQDVELLQQYDEQIAFIDTLECDTEEEQAEKASYILQISHIKAAHAADMLKKYPHELSSK